MAGTGLAQLLPLGVSPILTRLYSEKDFALYTSFFAIASILAVGVGARYQLAIILPKSDVEARKIFSLSIYITIIYSFFLLLAALWMVNKSINQDLGRAIYFVPLYILFFGFWNSHSYLSFRYKTFFQNAVAKVLQSLLFVGVGIVLGLFKFTVFGLVLAKISGVLASWIYLYKKAERRVISNGISDIQEVAKKYRDYPSFGLIPAFLDIASVQGLILILSWFYSTDDLGFFGLTVLVLSGPLGLVGGSFKDVFYQKMTSLINAGHRNRSLYFFRTSAIGLLLIGLPVCVILFLGGENIFRLIFGEKWARSGEFASILSFSFLIQLVVSPLSSVFNAAGKIKIASLWQTLYFISTFLTLGISSAIFKLPVKELLFVYVIHEVILYTIYFLLQYWTLKNLT
jgi:O-antigen/teichoic acid export membrane protein